MWRAYAKAGATADAGDADLPRYASGAALKALQNGLASYRGKGQVLKGEYASAPQVSGVSPAPTPSTVSIVDCLDDSKFLVFTTSGEPVNDKPGGRRSTKATVTDVGGQGWKVTSFGVQGVGTC
jgi:hypothetical protein